MLEPDEQSLYQQGFQAYLDGIQVNPYSLYGEQGQQWQRGWNTAKYGESLNGSK